jgi:hypothetical protein
MRSASIIARARRRRRPAQRFVQKRNVVNSNIEKLNRFIFGSRESTFASFFHDDEDGAHDRLIRAMTVATSPVVVDVFASSPCDSPREFREKEGGDDVRVIVGDAMRREKTTRHDATRTSFFDSHIQLLLRAKRIERNN